MPTTQTTFAKRRIAGQLLGSATLAVAAAILAGAPTQADTTIVTPTTLQSHSSGWYTDTTNASNAPTNGTAAISTAEPDSGNASFELATPTSSDYASVEHLGGNGATLPTIINGPYHDLRFDNFTTGTSTSMPTFHLFFGSTFQDQLVWEGSYNSVTPTDNQLQTVSIADGLYWARVNGTSYNGGGQTKTLSGWVADQSIPGTSTSITLGTNDAVGGYSLSVGTGTSAYLGYVDNVTLGGNTANFESPSPEPSQLVGLGFSAFGAMGLILVPRRKKSQASAA